MTPDPWSAVTDELRGRLLPLSHEADLPSDTRHAAVSIVLRWMDGPEVLLMVRAEDENDPWSGHVALPGGHRDPGDVSLVHTASRETLEEVGVNLELCAHPIGLLESMQARARAKTMPLWVTPVIFLQHSPAPIALGPEASHAFHLPIRPLLAGHLDAEHPIERDHQVRRYPAWRFEERTIWGMTHHILTQCLERVQDLPGFRDWNS
ncbi:MAG: CoA pyrophosphatase [Planctomycetes bacterium]|nr:CoA pyrophosphatase [Planctomycetota bacterium]